MRKWLKKIREGKKMTMSEVSMQVGISECYYSMIESGKRGKPLKVDIAMKIAEELNFDWTKFYEEDLYLNKKSHVSGV